MAESKASRTMRVAAGIVGPGSLAVLVKEYGIGGVFYALFEVVIAAIYSMGDLILLPFRKVAEGLALFIEETILAGLQIIGVSGRYSAFSLTQGEWAFFGPFTFPVGVVVVLLALSAVLYWMRRFDWRPWKLITGRR